MIRIIVDEREGLYLQHKHLAKWLGSRFARRFGVNKQDAIEEAETALALLVCGQWSRFNPRKSSARTWITTKLYWHLMEYWRNEEKRQGREISIEELMTLDEEDRPPEPEHRRGLVEQLWEGLGNEGRMLLRVIFEAPGVLGEELWSAKRGGEPKLKVKVQGINEKKRRAVLRYLRSQGWTKEQTRTAWKQVEEVCLG